MEGLDAIFSLVGFMALVYMFVNFLKNLTNKKWNGVITQLVAWGAGVGATLLAKQTSFAATWDLGGHVIGSFSTYDAIYFGLLVASFGSLVYDWKKAKDNTDTAVSPPLTKL